MLMSKSVRNDIHICFRISISCARVLRQVFWLGPDKTALPLGCSSCCVTSMDSECPIANVQPTLDDGATPSAEACDRRLRAQRPASEALARDRARRRELLGSEERERRLSQRRVRDRARHAASRPSALIVKPGGPVTQMTLKLCSTRERG